MTERSYFWDGLVTGDAASYAPYSSTEYEEYFQCLLDSHLEEAFVIPGYNNELLVSQQTPIAMGVSVATGALTLLGKIYENTATVNLSVTASDPLLQRVDSVVATVDFTTQTIRMEVVAGTSTALNPSPPTLSSTSSKIQIELARIYIYPGTTAIVNNIIEERRIFAYNSNNVYYSRTNLLNNPEFMAYCESTFPATKAPEMWNQYSSTLLATFDIAAKPDQMSRGRSIKITSTTSDRVGIKQTINIKPSTRYSIRLLVKNTDINSSGVLLQVSTNSSTPVILTKTVLNPVNEWKDVWLYFTTESNVTTLTISITCINTTVYVGQCSVVEGYSLDNYSIKREQIMFSSDGEFYVTTSTTGSDVIIDFDVDVPYCAPEGVYAVVYSLEGEADSGAGQAEIAIKNRFGGDSTSECLGFLKLDGSDTDNKKTMTGIVGLYPSLSNPKPRTLAISADSTLTITIKFIGVAY